jgi:hypothetical protein
MPRQALTPVLQGFYVMKKLIISAACGLLLAAAPVLAQPPRGALKPAAPNKTAAPEKEKTPPANGLSMSHMPPEMWLYMQERDRHDDPKEAVRRKAEYRTEQRLRRMAAREWFGYSNARPTANPEPFHSTYSPHWSANNPMRPDQWIGNSRTAFRR